MKRIFNYILAALFLAAAMSLNTSCQKENPIPDKPVQQEPPGKEEPGKTETEPLLAVSLPERTDTLVYPAEAIVLPFTVTENSETQFYFKSESSNSAKVAVSVNQDKKSGTVTITPDSDRGNADLVFSNGKKETTVSVRYETYYLDLESAPEDFGDGTPCERTVLFRTNLPEGSVTVNSSVDWIEAVVTGVGEVTLYVAGNGENAPRDGAVYICAPQDKLKKLVVGARQDYVLVEREDMVSFKDKAFQEYMLSVADKDGDHFVSFEEALEVKEVDIENRGVKDISGLEYFKNVWKFNGRGNDIEDATILKELPRLYWMDLKGNKNLKTFDLTGCSIYFEHRDFEMTEDLHYFMTRQQTQKYPDFTDPWYTKSKHIVDSRESTDYSRQGELTLIKEHTLGKGYPMVYVVWGAIDVDVNDGSYERLVRDAMELQFEYGEEIKPYKEYFDIYMLIHIRPNRNEYRLGHETTNQETREAMEWVEKRQTAIYDETYNRLVPDSDGICEMYMQFLGLNTSSRSYDAYGTSIRSWKLSMPGSDKGIYSVFNINRRTGDEEESSYGPGVNSSLLETLEINAWIKANEHFNKGEFFDIFVLGTKSYNP